MPGCEGVVHLRRARENDARGIAEAHVRTWQHAYRGLLPADVLARLDVDTRERWWRGEIHVLPENRRPWIAEASSEIGGFISVGPSRDDSAPATTGEVYAIYVVPDCWDRGLGWNLLQHGVRDLVEHGYAEAILWVFADNERARRFYESAGWQADGAERSEEFGGLEMTEVRYRRSLEPSRV